MKKPIYMVLITIFFVSVFLGLGALSASSEQAPKVKIETVFLNISYELSNNVGRTLTDVDVKSYLPMFAVENDEISKSKLTFSNNNYLLAEFKIEKIIAEQKLTYSNRYSIDVGEVAEGASSASIYKSTITDEKRLSHLQVEWDRTKDIKSFVQSNPQIDSLDFLAGVLSKTKQIRIVAGVDKNIGSEQKVMCWLQEFNEDKWQTLGAEEKDILPFKVLASGEPVTEAYCGKSLVDAWALDVSNYKITVTTKS